MPPPLAGSACLPSSRLLPPPVVLSSRPSSHQPPGFVVALGCPRWCGPPSPPRSRTLPPTRHRPFRCSAATSGAPRPQLTSTCRRIVPCNRALPPSPLVWRRPRSSSLPAALLSGLGACQPRSHAGLVAAPALAGGLGHTGSWPRSHRVSPTCCAAPMVCEGKIRRQGLYAEADINSIVAAQLQHYQVQQRVQQHPGNSCAGRDAAQISEGDHMVLKARQSQCDRDGTKAAVNQLPWYAYNEGQGAEGAQSFCEGQRSDQKFELEKQDGEDPKNQDHGNKIEARYKDNTRPRTFDSLEHKFHRDILLLPKEQHDKEDAEIAWHSEVNFQAALASESLLNEEAVMAAAASEAVALARAGVVAAREVARMVQTDYDQPVIRSHKAVDSFLVKEILRTEMVLSSTNGHTGDDLLEEIEFYSIKSDKAELDDGKYAKCIAVKSARQSERRARRVRAATKASTILSTAQKPVTSPKKKRSKGSLSGTNPLGSLWKMTGRRLLTAKQEIEFSKGIQDLLNLEAIQTELAEYNGGQPTFSQWAAAAGIDENTLRKRIDHGIYCKNRMVTSNVRLVISIAREFEGSGMELYDLIQEGMQGLIRGAEKFDASKGFRFSTYSHWWIKQAMRKSASEQSHIFRLPAHMVDASYRVKECTKRFRRQFKRRPTNEEIALETGMPVKRVEAAVNLPKYTISLDSKVGCTDMTYQEITPDPSAETAEVILNRWLMIKEVNKALDSLTAREKQVVRLRFGLDDGRIKTLQEIGNLMGVSRERIRQIESGAFRKLRNKKRVDALKHYLDPVDNW